MKQDIWRYCSDHLARVRPDQPVWYFDPGVLARTARVFSGNFDGLVTYAVKANPARAVIENLVAAGITAFDVASPAEMASVRAVLPEAGLHYNNPVRSEAEVQAAIGQGVKSYAVDHPAALDKLAKVPPGTEIAVRLHLPVKGAAYDFGAKFGASPEAAAQLLRQVHRRGLEPSMTFHPGTQCTDPAAWARYIAGCADVARSAGVPLGRLNVGGGFPACRGADRPDLMPIFAAIHASLRGAFDTPPKLVCEPGRAMVADAFSLAIRIKEIRGDALYLNDGIYGTLAEMRDIGPVHRIRAISGRGALRCASPRPCRLFGPTCDSLDALPDPVPLPCDLQEGDYLLIEGMGAYAACIATRFNGYGAAGVVTLNAGSGQRPIQG